MFKNLVSIGALAALLLLPGAAFADGMGPKSTSASTQIAAAHAAEWKKLVNAARKEGKVEVILGGQMPRKLRKIMPEFEKKYGVKVNFQTGSSRRHSARIRAERKGGKFTVDAWIGGANTALSILLPNKMLAPVDELLLDPEVKNPKLWYQG